MDPVLARITVGDWATHWLDNQTHLKPSTHERYAGIVREHIRPKCNRVRLANVSHADSLAATGSRPDAPLVIADTREQVAQLNGLIHDVRVATREVMPGVVTRAGEKIGVGDRIATRRNDPDLDVANRETWTATSHGEDGSLTVNGRTGSRNLPAAYATGVSSSPTPPPCTAPRAKPSTPRTCSSASTPAPPRPTSR